MARTRMSHDYGEKPVPLTTLPGAALRAVVSEGYTKADFRQDLLAGLVVGTVALPLAMALAVAVGVAPQHGLYTAIIGGLVIALFGGSRMQVSGPTAAFVVVLAPIYVKFGLGGLLLSGLLAGLIMIAMGVMRLGKLIQFIPHPVTTGFTAGIGTVIAALQIKDLLGLQPLENPSHFVERLMVMVEALPTASIYEAGIGLGTLAILILAPRVTKRVPAPLIALPIAALAAFAVTHFLSGTEIDTIATRFDGIPQSPPIPSIAWFREGPGGNVLLFDYSLFRELVPGAFAIAMLGAIESLLSAVVADGMAHTRHDPDAELLAQGVGNVIVPFFGGIAATGAIARTATNVRSGAKSPVSGIVHAVTVLLAMLLLAPLLGRLPMAALAALLLLVAWNMSDIKHVRHTIKVAPKSDVAVLVTCFALTVMFDMVTGVAVGMVLAALLFMRRMAEVTRVKLRTETPSMRPANMPDNVVVYEISGPLFFGAAQKAMGAMRSIASSAKAVVLMMNGVQAMDATGLVALESALDELKSQGCLVRLVGVQPQPQTLIERARIHERPGVQLCSDLTEAYATLPAP